ncbi:hypothetical protein ACFL1B_05130 [Nanoarchaeota archaeon]
MTEKTTEKEIKKDLKITKNLLRAGAIIAYTAGALYCGDRMDIQSNYTIPLHDRVFNIPTAPSFADQKSLDFITIVNERNQREVYLRFDKKPGSNVQITPIDSSGYAVPESFYERVQDYLNQVREDLENLKLYEKLDQFRDQLEVVIKHYSIKARRLIDNIFSR